MIANDASCGMRAYQVHALICHGTVSDDVSKAVQLIDADMADN
jgi:hypothetical protein